MSTRAESILTIHHCFTGIHLLIHATIQELTLLIPISERHYDDVIMTMLASQITSLTVVYSIGYSGVNQRKHQSSASLAFVREIHRGPVNFPHKWPVTRKMFPFDDVIMETIGASCSEVVCLWLFLVYSIIPFRLLFDVILHHALRPTAVCINGTCTESTDKR